MRVLRRNPVETWTKAHFEWPILVGPIILGTIVMVDDPAAIRRVLIDNAANYCKDALQKRVLGPGLRDGLVGGRRGRQAADQQACFAGVASQLTGLSNTITLETKALMSRAWVKPEVPPIAPKSSSI